MARTSPRIVVWDLRLVVVDLDPHVTRRYLRQSMAARVVDERPAVHIHVFERHPDSTHQFRADPCRNGRSRQCVALLGSDAEVECLKRLCRLSAVERSPARSSTRGAKCDSFDVLAKWSRRRWPAPGRRPVDCRVKGGRLQTWPTLHVGHRAIDDPDRASRGSKIKEAVALERPRLASPPARRPRRPSRAAPITSRARAA